MQSQNGLILTRNIVPACQIRSILENEAMTAEIVLSDLDVYANISRQPCHFLICDIDDPDLQGIFVAEWFRYQSQGAPWYAICHYGNSRNMRLAREKGASGYFFLNGSGLALDAHSGMAHTLLTLQKSKARQGYRFVPKNYQPQPSF